MDRQNAKVLAQDMLAALESVAQKHGVKFSQKSGNYTGTTLTLRIEAAILNADGVAETRERKDYTLYCNLYDLKPEWLDATFPANGTTYQIVGLNTRKHKNPVLAKRTDNGKIYIFPADIIKLRMAMQGEKAARAAQPQVTA